MRKRILYIVKSVTDTDWVSTRAIESVVKSAVSGGNFPYEVRPFSEKCSGEELAGLSAAMEYADCFLFLVSELLDLPGIVKATRNIAGLTYVIPVYGNMTSRSDIWSQLSRELQGRRAILLGASHRHCQQLSLLTEGGSIRKLPYPVREEFLSTIKSDAHETIRLVYAGRITIQKNLLPLLRTFLRASQVNPKLELHLAGRVHHLGYPFHGIFVDTNRYYSEVIRLVEASEGKIVFHGELTASALAELFDRCDVAVSMSTHHDEDFGLALAEGSCRGLPVIVSDWGGHGEYAAHSWNRLIPLKINPENVPLISEKDLLSSFLDLREAPSAERRATIRAQALRRFSPESYTKTLAEILSAPVKEYIRQTPEFESFADSSVRKYPLHPLAGGRGPGSLYERIYSSYLHDFIDHRKFSP